MELQYVSTRDASEVVSASQAIFKRIGKWWWIVCPNLYSKIGCEFGRLEQDDLSADSL